MIAMASTTPTMSMPLPSQSPSREEIPATSHGHEPACEYHPSFAVVPPQPTQLAPHGHHGQQIGHHPRLATASAAMFPQSLHTSNVSTMPTHAPAPTSATKLKRSFNRISSQPSRNPFESSSDVPQHSNAIAESSSVGHLDFHTVESSLKRVRLTRSPGELRLQQDLKQLSQQGWEAIGASTWMLMPPQTQFSHDAHQQDSASHLPACSAKLEQLNRVDSMRLLLTVQAQSTGSQHSVWIQIPRMYPHRPPLVSRIESSSCQSWRKIERIVITEAPPSGINDVPSPRSTCCDTVVLFDQWSPIMWLGELLRLIIRVLIDPTDSPQGHSSLGTAERSDARAAAPAGASYFPAQHNNKQPSDAHGDHTMDDDAMDDHHRPQHSAETGSITAVTAFFPPNRFKTGFGSYRDPLSDHQKYHSAALANRMEV